MSVRSTLTRGSVLIAAGLAAALTLSACGSLVRPAGQPVDRVGGRLRLRCLRLRFAPPAARSSSAPPTSRRAR